MSFGQPPSSYLVVTDRKGNRHTHTMYDFQRETVTNAITQPQSLQIPLLICPDGDYIAGRARGESKARAYAMANGEMVLETDLPAGPSALGFADSDHLFVIDSPPGGSSRATLWNLPQKKKAGEFSLNGVVHANAAVASPGGNQLAVVAGDSLQIYDLNSYQNLGSLPLAQLGSLAGKPSSSEALTCQGLAYSHDGVELAALFETASGFQLVSWSVSRARPLLNEFYLRKSIVELPGVAKYLGDPLEWWPDRGGWLFFGHALVDRAGEIIKTLPATTNHSRRMIHPDVIMGVGMARNQLRLGSSELYPEDSDRNVPNLIIRSALVTRVLDRLVPSNLKPARDIPWPTQQVNWTVPIVAAQSQTLRASGDIPLGESTAYGLGGMWLAPDRPERAALLAKRSFSGNWTLDLLDLRSGKMKKSIPLGDLRDPKLRCFSPQGNAAIVQVDTALHLYSFWRGELVLEWKPNAAQHTRFAKDPFGEDIQARFIDESRVLTLDSDGTLALWQLPDCIPEWKIDDFGETFALSHDRQYVFGGSEGRVACFHVESGNCAGRLESLAFEPTLIQLGISPDGSRMVGFAQGLPNEWFGAEWDLADGRRLSQFWLAPAKGQDNARRSLRSTDVPGMTDPIFLSGRNVLLDGQSLVDLDRQVTLCDYETNRAGLAWGAPPGEVWLVGMLREFNESKLAARKLQIPSPDILQQTSHMTIQHQALLGPGSHVKLEMAGVPDTATEADSKEQPGGTGRLPLRTVIEQSLNAAGYTIHPEAPAVIRITYQEKELNGSIRYHADGGIKSFPQREATCSIRLELGGHVVEVDTIRGQNTAGMYRTDDPEGELNSRMRAGVIAQLRNTAFPRWYFLDRDSLNLPKLTLKLN